MNKTLAEFLDLITDLGNAANPDTYVNSRKLHDPNLTLVMSYLNGSAHISGIAFDKQICILYNALGNPDGFCMQIDGVHTKLPITKENVAHFFEYGKLIDSTPMKND